MKDVGINKSELFDYFKQELQETVLSHPIIKHNSYLEWFSQADIIESDIIYFTKTVLCFFKPIYYCTIVKNY